MDTTAARPHLRAPRYRHVRGLERVVRTLGLWRQTGNTLPPLVNARYRSNLRRSQAAFASAHPEAPSWPDSECTVNGYEVVRSGLDRSFAKQCSQRFGQAIAETKGLVTLPDGKQNSIKLARPFDLFGEDLLNVFRGPVDNALKNHFKSYYRIEWMDCYRSIPADGRAGSWLWHKDNVPFACIKAMIHLTETTLETGAMQFLDWADTRMLHETGYFGVRATERVPDIKEWATRRGKSITVRHVDAQPGDVLLFNNNLLHSAIPPRVRYRDVCTVMIVPCEVPWDEALARQGLSLIQDFTDGYPADPALR